MPASPKILFLATEDWFFASHFLPMARAAREMGLEVVVVARVRDARAPIEATGARLVALEADRRSLDPRAIGGAVGQVAEILRREKPDILHCIALRSILIGGAAARQAGIGRLVFALTGLGFLGAKRGLVGVAARLGVRTAIRRVFETPGTRYLFENPDDPRLLGLDPGAETMTIVGGAGIDPEALHPAPLPGGETLRIALVARMLWSKGIDLAVEAVGAARAGGADVELSLYGAPDPANPKAIPAEQLDEWSRRDGISWHGPTRDVAAVWRNHHAACLPSRGGEGLPRTLLEAAACGRALLTTDVPGCRSFVRDGIEGRVVQPAAAPLASAISALARDRPLVARMGEAARARVLDGYTERDVMEVVKRLYASLLPA
ncbi:MULTISPECIES: glycosyltransferase family 4 protein [unclassified Aureimonas]|uniref:glycosyltransferase family 4 protein n=1 Tax=unclassified Aureimonas TaxID=2615206 RepID=UPI0006F4B51C|nr:MULTISPECIES: glycosyltransferase family 4 protein [unclassified Aureimonas]KQT57338.1 glycosyl transferase family 1 [Aureimonas sp. Leaf427]KQT77018.1 glycosyl transferase family 1 [Aureimonas sp. Leaf460]